MKVVSDLALVTCNSCDLKQTDLNDSVFSVIVFRDIIQRHWKKMFSLINLIILIYEYCHYKVLAVPWVLL